MALRLCIIQSAVRVAGFHRDARGELPLTEVPVHLQKQIVPESGLALIRIGPGCVGVAQRGGPRRRRAAALSGCHVEEKPETALRFIPQTGPTIDL